jgi:hypothetical protein
MGSKIEVIEEASGLARTTVTNLRITSRRINEL